MVCRWWCLGVVFVLFFSSVGCSPQLLPNECLLIFILGFFFPVIFFFWLFGGELIMAGTFLPDCYF